MLMHGAAILDFEVGVGEVFPTFRVGNPTENSEIQTSEFKWNAPYVIKRVRHRFSIALS